MSNTYTQIKINEFFTLKEFVAEEDLKAVLSNPFILSNIIELADILERLRKKIGKPLIITSGYRNPEKNKKVGGADKSAHLLGKACDWTLEWELHERENITRNIVDFFRNNDYIVGEFICYFKNYQGKWLPSRFHFATPFYADGIKHKVFLVSIEKTKKYKPFLSDPFLALQQLIGLI